MAAWPDCYRAYFLEHSLGVQFAQGRCCGNCWEYRPRSPADTSGGVCARHLVARGAQHVSCGEAFAPIDARHLDGT
jgi:hypothetical protein